MKTESALRSIMEAKEITVSSLASRMGKSSRLVCERIGQNNISIAKLNEMLRLMDYKIVLVPREARMPEGGFEIE